MHSESVISRLISISQTMQLLLILALWFLRW